MNFWGGFLYTKKFIWLDYWVMYSRHDTTHRTLAEQADLSASDPGRPPDQTTDIPIEFSTCTSRTLLACGQADACSGAGLSLPLLVECVKAAAHTWPTSSLGDWYAELNTDANRLTKVVETDSGSVGPLFSTANSKSTLLQNFQSWTTDVHAAGFENQLDALLGRAIVMAAQANQQIEHEIISGLQTLKRARTGKGRRSPDWERLTPLNLTSVDDVQQVSEDLGPSSPTWPFLSKLLVLQQTPVVSPAAITTASSSHTDISDKSLDQDSKSSPGNTEETANEHTQKKKKPGKKKSPIASISARMAEANYATPAEKLGIHSRDHLLLDDLIPITQKVTADLNSDDRKTRTYACLATLCHVTATSDYQAINFQFFPKLDGIWIDLESGCWCWDFLSYKLSSPTTDLQKYEPVRIPLPKKLHAALSAAQRDCEDARTVGDLIKHLLAEDEIELTGYRTYLRNLGDAEPREQSPHPSQDLRKNLAQDDPRDANPVEASSRSKRSGCSG